MRRMMLVLALIASLTGPASARRCVDTIYGYGCCETECESLIQKFNQPPAFEKAIQVCADKSHATGNDGDASYTAACLASIGYSARGELLPRPKKPTIAARRKAVATEEIPSTPRESDAIISDSMTARQVDALAAMVRLHGYKCDTISGAHPWLMSYGFTVVCNGFRYKYDVQDKGGTWTVTVE